ncbi:RNA methyltransferase [Aquibaculum sediminis]|uniref:RNA methyltransferase n=1 Tax=Aquibaculum sediminis TaxID=3231907 RepID=UPI003453C0C0
MAGTNRTVVRPAAIPGPAVILVAPQLGENIGMVARAMLNCGLSDLRLVQPRDGWPNQTAERAAAGALSVLEGVRVYETTQAAVADLHRLYITTARNREQVKAIVTPRQAAREIRTLETAGERVGLLFGPERTGLSNDDVALGDVIVNVPLNPGFSSLNLAQAVLLLAYEWYQADDETPARSLHLGGGRPAEKQELIGFFERLEATLEQVGFFHPPEKAPGMRRNLRTLIDRATPTEQEVRTLHGVLSALLGAKLKRAPRPEASEGDGSQPPA